MERALTDRSQKAGRPTVVPKTLKVVRKGSAPPRQSNKESIADGLQFIFGLQRDHHWTELTWNGQDPSVWVSAYVVARLGDAPASFFSPAQYQRVEHALEWLQQARAREGGWGCSSNTEADADSTAWAMLAFRHHAQPVPRSVTNWLQSCRRADGGFALHPEGCQKNCCQASRPGVTAVAAKALDEVDSNVEQYLAAHLQNPGSGEPAMLESHAFVCSEILDCETALAPWSLLNRVCRLASLGIPRNSLATALLLRSLLRLRMRRASHMAENLRALQRADGSWPGSVMSEVALAGVWSAGGEPPADRSGLLATATAVSALVLAESQSGLYDGSYLPRPRRLPEL